ncbi:multiple sugar transport system permease protein [Actinoplanes lutulentus]|uniref:Carbohydrate ABC transporter membrane protein 2 (CUT1 family) n=1 Tax=Actinoplanes lutulentus TaxID=1287878 RepID=A0A327Z2V2_9ACTN|nr:carbohydrate ABC transporter permease [Actinoplanes lutulentus]MBB2943739.1 multiple sugar transport system permease protein [Actinoplanes lutulentus]RAK29281.1 carbohydrate ABC transporter membrane protein 2 (CUT1 family) [Actinoplanes lutulentus]
MKGTRRDRAQIETRVLNVLRPLVITVLLVTTLFPFLYMLLLSVRPIEQLLQNPGQFWAPPSAWTVSTYQEVLTSVADGGQGFLRLLTNSAIVSVAATVLTLLVSIPGAYAVSRLRFTGRRQVHFLFLSVYLFPSILLAIPLFVLFTRLGLRGSLAGLTFVYIAQTVPVSIYMLRNYLSTIPESLEEAAAVDGYGRLQTLVKIVLPLAAPAVMANALYVFMIAWNEFLFALLFLVEDRADWTVSLGLAQLSGGIEVSKTVLMAGSVVLTLPIVIIFFAAERLLTEGLTAGAEKA